MGRKIINSKNRPMSAPLLPMIVIYLFFEKIKAPEWLYGVFGLIFSVLWIIFIWDAFTHEELSPFK